MRPIRRGNSLSRAVSNHTLTNGSHSLSHSKAVHTRAHSQERTQRLTGANRGGTQMVGAITTLGVRCAVRNLCARRGQKNILCHLCMDRGNVGEKQRAFGTETRTVRVSVPRRRGPAGPRCSTAASCSAPVSFAGRHRCDEGQRENCWRVCCAFVCSVGRCCGAGDSSLVTAVHF